MRIADSEKVFRTYLHERGKVPETVLPEELLSFGFEFFENVRVVDALPVTEKEMGDALLFQWGTSPAIPGHREQHFYVDLTRQFIALEGEGDDAMFQLAFCLNYAPNESLRAIGTGNRWCATLESLPEFRRFAFNHPALAAVRGRIPKLVEFYLTPL